MSTSTRVAQCIYRMDKNDGDFIGYLVRVAVSPTLKREQSDKSFAGAVDLRNKWWAEREELKKAKPEPDEKDLWGRWLRMPLV